MGTDPVDLQTDLPGVDHGPQDVVIVGYDDDTLFAVPSVDEVDALVVDKEPQLIIANNYNIITSDRADRIKEIEKILKSKNIVFSFFNETHPSSH